MFNAPFKAKAALEAIKGHRTISELTAKHKRHATQINLWKKQLLEGAESIFENGNGNGKKVKSASTDEPQAAELYEQIGRLKVQLEWLKKKWPKSVSEARTWIDFGNPQLSVREQCRLLGLHRNNVYDDPVPETKENLRLMRMMDEEHLKRPHRGSRQMVDFFEDQGTKVNRKRIQRLMRKWVSKASRPNAERRCEWKVIKSIRPCCGISK